MGVGVEVRVQQEAQQLCSQRAGFHRLPSSSPSSPETAGLGDAAVGQCLHGHCWTRSTSTAPCPWDT